MEAKIVFTGPAGAGKTTAISVLSDVPPVAMDVANHDPELRKQRTTVGLDFGLVSLGDGACVRLVGTPGQDRFEFMWPILMRNAIGVVILLDHSDQSSFLKLSSLLRSLSAVLASTACVVGVGRAEAADVETFTQYSQVMEELGYAFPVLPVDVRERSDVLTLVAALLWQAEARTSVGVE